MNKKHWRDTYKSDFLANWDLEKDVVLTITTAYEKEVSLSKGKEKKIVAFFEEKLLENGVSVKPMILNPTNCKFIQMKTGKQFPIDWAGLKIRISVKENNEKIGDKNCLRIVEVIKEKNFDISEILSLMDIQEVTKKAKLFKSNMDENQINLVRKHIKTLTDASNL